LTGFAKVNSIKRNVKILLGGVMKRPDLVLLILALAAVAFAETNLTGSPGPAAPYVERHSALDKYPFKNDGGDQLN